MADAPHKNLTKSEYQSKNNVREEHGGNFHNIYCYNFLDMTPGTPNIRKCRQIRTHQR